MDGDGASHEVTRAALERGIARLEREVARATSELERARAKGVRPRGFGAGLLVATALLAVVLACAAGFLWMLGAAIGHVG